VPVAERVDTVVIGAGQAGLATSFLLSGRGREHVVLEQGRVAETWRTRRWDGFRLNTPNHYLRLPGHEYAGDDPEAFLTRDETVAYLERYAESAHVPLRTARVSSLASRGAGGFSLETSDGPLEAGNVVVATGAYQRPAPPSAPGAPAAGILQLHSADYRRPDQLPPGGVLVIGSGQSGCQIADELKRDGRDVYLSVGRCPTLATRYRGRSVYRWMIDIGLMDETVDTLPSPDARLAGNVTVTSDDGGHLCGPRKLARAGVVLVGRVEAIDGRRAILRPDLGERLADSEAFAARIKLRIDDCARDAGLDLPPEPDDDGSPAIADERTELDLRAAGIGTVLWANGFRPDYGWIGLPVFDDRGWPVQRRGVTAVPGLYFVGVHWLHKRKSALLLGVGEDADHVVSTMAG
jgi:putative flavoprotein involved in K+ transport